MKPESLMTIVPVRKDPNPITHNNTILLIGSCFSEYIGEHLSINRFRICRNPTGILYNPLSIQTALEFILNGKKFTEDDLFFYRDLWRSWQHHTKFSTPDKHETLKAMNDSIEQARQIFTSLDFLIITPGTSFVYYLKESQTVVANCHGVTQNNFERKLTQSQVIAETFSNLFTRLLNAAPNLRIIFSVSPVRHLRDAPHENTISKSNLISAIYELEQRFERISYFPAYEIMMDELRDYRFYDTDLVHPNQTAVNYIWDKFRSSYISDRSNDFINLYSRINSSKNHRIQFPDSPSTKSFARSSLDMIDSVSVKFTEIDFSDDRKYFSQYL